MTPRPPRSTQAHTLFPYTTLFRSALFSIIWILQSRKILIAEAIGVLPAATSVRRSGEKRNSNVTVVLHEDHHSMWLRSFLLFARTENYVPHCAHEDSYNLRIAYEHGQARTRV